MLQRHSIPLAPQQRIVAVEDHFAVLTHTLNNFHLRLQNTFFRAQILDMCGTDIDDHRHIWQSDGRQIGDLPEVIHAHFQNRHLRVLRHSKDRHGHTQIIILIDRCFLHTKLSGKDLSNHFLCGAFTYRSGNANHLHTDALALCSCNVA